MNSRELYHATEHLTTVLTWDKEWIHFGTGDEVNTKLIEDLITNFLGSSKVNLVYERTNSGTFNCSEILPRIKELLGTKNFQLWNESLEQAIRFNQIGVLLKGKKNAIQHSV